MRTKLWTLATAVAVVTLMTADFGTRGDLRVVNASTTRGGSAAPAPGAKASTKPRPTPKAKASPNLAPTAAPTPPARTPAPRSTPKPSPRSTTSPTARPAATARATASLTPAAGAIVAPSTRAMPDQALTSDLEAGPTGGPVTLLLPLVVGSFAAIVLLGIARRRLTASTNAASGSGSEPGVESPSDAFVPRWLRPSLAAARAGTGSTTVIRAAAADAIPPDRPPRVFTGAIGPGVERVLVRYDRVPLLDVPNDALGRTKAELDGNDEVEVIERDGIWAQVRTPTGAVGWVPTMTIAQRAGASTDDDSAAPTSSATPGPAPAADEPALEALIEAIVAQRLARQELADGDEAPAAPKQPRARKPRSDRPAGRRS